MHNYKTKTLSFNYNPDRSGDVIIYGTTVDISWNGHGSEPRVNVPLYELVEFVTELLRHEKIAELESMTTKELIGYMWK